MSEGPTLLEASLIESLIDERLDNVSESQSPGPETSSSVSAPTSLIEPTATAIDGWLDYSENPQSRWMTGFHRLDVLTRGLGRGEMMLCVGRSHSGKSQFLYQAIVNTVMNQDDARILIFSPDEPRELVVAKLYSIMFGVNGAEVEHALRNGDPEVKNHLQELGETGNIFDRLIIHDGSPSFRIMHDVMFEAEDYWQMSTTMAMVDYLELLVPDAKESGSQAVIRLAQACKRWCKEADLPLAVVHQSGRANERGTAGGISVARYGGEQESHQVIEIYRQRDQKQLTAGQAAFHKNSINVNLVKNKRPPNRLEDLLYYIDEDCGAISEYTTDREPRYEF
jgi:replicative DNA helicase